MEAAYDVDLFFFLMIRRPPRSTLDRSAAASDVYKRQSAILGHVGSEDKAEIIVKGGHVGIVVGKAAATDLLSLIHISEPTRPY